MKSKIFYTKTHEWLVFSSSENKLSVGITKYLKKDLGELAFIDFAAEIGENVSEGQVIVVLEASKVVSEILAPLGGLLVSRNSLLVENPRALKSLSQEDSWLFEISCNEKSFIEDNFMNNEEYLSYIGTKKNHG